MPNPFYLAIMALELAQKLVDAAKVSNLSPEQQKQLREKAELLGKQWDDLLPKSNG